jgi:hypothetical protein
MGIKIGNIDITDSLLNTEFRVLVLESIVDRLLKVSPPGVLSQRDLADIRDKAVESMQEKYPDAGIKPIKS